jgi:hypothetical protein
MSCFKAQAKHVGFMPTTRVRNQYECETGNVTLNEYNVNATKNNAMPGYTQNSKKFVPHSKSKIQQTPHTDLGPAISSVGNRVLPTHAEKREREYALSLKKRIYGNAWINAEVVEEEANLAAKPERNQILRNYQTKLEVLEAEFLKNTGFKAPTVLDREYEEQKKTVSPSELRRLNSEYFKARLESPYLKRYNFSVKKQELDRLREVQLRPSDKTHDEVMRRAKLGKGIPVTKRKTLKRRLRDAQRVRNAEYPWYRRWGRPTLKAATKLQN